MNIQEACVVNGRAGVTNDSYLSFLTLITDMMTSKLPKIAAMMINIIIDAEKTVIKTLIHSWSIISSVLVLLELLIVALKFETASKTASFIVRICSLLNDEEDDFGDNVWDDMAGLCVAVVVACLDSSQFPSFVRFVLDLLRLRNFWINSRWWEAN